MTRSNAGDPGNVKEAKLPRRDWFLLPALSLLTICLLFVSTELTARRMFTESETGCGRCLVFNDPSTGLRAIPNCVCREKKYENCSIEYRFNGSGYREDVEYGPKPPDTYRIVMIGSSIAMGADVEREKAFAALLPAELSQRTGLTVQLFNESIVGWGGTPRNIALRFNKVLAVQPDLVLWILSGGDVTRAAEAAPTTDIHPRRTLSFSARAWQFMKAAFTSQSVADAFAESLDRSRTAVLLRHYLYQSQTLYVKSSPIEDGRDAANRKTGPNQEKQRHLKDFDIYAASIETRAKAAGVPLVAVFMPDGQLAAMISRGEWPAADSPYKSDEELRPLIESHGGTYISILPDYRDIPNPEQGFFPVDGHPNADGHAVISRLLAKELTGGAVPSLKAAAQPQAAPEQGR